MIQKLKIKILYFLEEVLHGYLIHQIKGYLDIELGKNAAVYGLKIGYRTHDGINMYINDPKYCSKNSKDPIRFLTRSTYSEFEIEEKLRIGKYKYNEVLWLLTNIKDECFKMNLDINRYARVHNLEPLTQKEKLTNNY